MEHDQVLIDEDEHKELSSSAQSPSSCAVNHPIQTAPRRAPLSREEHNFAAELETKFSESSESALEEHKQVCDIPRKSLSRLLDRDSAELF
jgi:hypothetical protein